MACNTAHLLLPELEARLGKQFLSLISTTVANLKAKQVRCIGILASPTTIKTKLYESALGTVGIACKLPTAKEQQRIEEVIRGVIAGKVSTSKLEPIMQRLRAEGATHLLLGCTELSVAFAHSDDTSLLDPLGIITEQLLT
ncbi:MAG: aspartate/glutamate racemase family protein [Candidatus Saccharimonadales bacterium]